MPSVARLLLLACAFRDFLADALHLGLRGNPLDIHVYAFNKNAWHLISDWEDYATFPESPAQLAVRLFQAHMEKKFPETSPEYSYYDCRGAAEPYKWPKDVTLKNCEELNAREAGPFFIGLHENTDHSVDLPESVKTFLLRRDADKKVVFISEAGPTKGFNDRDPAQSNQYRWTKHMPMEGVPSGYAVWSMLPSIPPAEKRWTAMPDEWKTYGGVESIMYAVKQALAPPPVASVAVGGRGSPPPAPTVRGPRSKEEIMEMIMTPVKYYGGARDEPFLDFPVYENLRAHRTGRPLPSPPQNGSAHVYAPIKKK